MQMQNSTDIVKEMLWYWCQPQTTIINFYTKRNIAVWCHGYIDAGNWLRIDQQ